MRILLPILVAVTALGVLRALHQLGSILEQLEDVTITPDVVTPPTSTSYGSSCAHNLSHGYVPGLQTEQR